MTIKLPERVEAAIAEYKAEVERAYESARRVDARTAEVQAELERAKSELDEATDAAILEPTPASTRRETELRKKVAELTLELSGAEHRKRRVFAMKNARERELALASIKAGREEAERYFYEHYDAVLQKIADAKYAYLSACVDYYRLQRQANWIYREAVNQTNPNYVQPGSSPDLKTEYFFYRGGDRQIYGINEQEVMRATRQGKILETSCPKGKAIE